MFKVSLQLQAYDDRGTVPYGPVYKFIVPCLFVLKRVEILDFIPQNTHVLSYLLVVK